ncbi:MAG: hypothetical protein ACI9R3_002728 [Verrucomicrobiales bacterium]|jgi:hypothetical protein
MNRRISIFIMIAGMTLFSAPSTVNAGDFWDFLRDAWETIQSRHFQNNQSSADTLEDEILASAARVGVVLSDPNQYDEYAGKLAKTLGMLSPEQQARVFGEK